MQKVNPLRLLVSAFEPFGDRRRNTSADLLRKVRLSSLFPLDQVRCHKILLPVNFDTAWPRLLCRLEAWKPDLVILTGEGKSNPVTLETAARNQRRGELENAAIDPALPFVRHSAAAEQLSAALRSIQGISIENDPGDYLCNYTYFQCLSHQPEKQVLFLHVHPLPEDDEEAKLVRIKNLYERAIQTAIELQSRTAS